MNEVFIIVTCNNDILDVCRSESKAKKTLDELFQLYYDLKPRIIRKKLI